MKPGCRIPGLAELKTLSLADLEHVAVEIRAQIIDVTSRNGGHLGASLGAVEIAIALHRVFQSPEEPIIWDVGHQAYAHKLLTGREDVFSTLRQCGGISGFLSRDESPHDVFGAGHSSTAVAAALGFSWRDHSSWTVAVVGDGALTAGIAFEALQNTANSARGPLLIVVNDNQMSISENVGGISELLSNGKASAFFESLGLDYLGPGDGHDLAYLLGALSGIRERVPLRPVVLHLRTQKGRGYLPAEEHPEFFHGVGPNQAADKISSVSPVRLETYSERASRAVIRVALDDARICAVSAAMLEGTGLAEFGRKYPARTIDVGIAEPHAVTFAAGMAAAGLRPFVAIYSTFLQRAIDSLIHDVGIQGLPVVVGVDRAGVVGQDGPTHHGLFDLVYLGMIPHFKVIAPGCLSDVDYAVGAAFGDGGPVAIRYPRGSGREVLEGNGTPEFRVHQEVADPEWILVALGTTAPRAAAATLVLGREGIRVTCVSTIFAKPIASELVSYLRGLKRAGVITLEDGVIRGGFGQALRLELGHRSSPFEHIGYGDEFVPQGTVEELEAILGLDSNGIVRRVKELKSQVHEE